MSIPFAASDCERSDPAEASAVPADVAGALVLVRQLGLLAIDAVLAQFFYQRSAAQAEQLRCMRYHALGAVSYTHLTLPTKRIV